MKSRPQRVLVIGPTPPPYHGVAVSTKLILQAPALQRFHLLHLDTADRRSIENIGKFDIGNVFMALWHALTFLGMVIRHWPNLIYLPISQGTPGFLRDCTFLLPAIWLRIPIIIHLRGSEFPEFYGRSSLFIRYLIRYTLGRVHQAIVLGENLRGIFGDLILPERISVIPNGTEDFVTGTAVSQPPDKVYGLYLGNLRIRKGFLVTLEAVVEALERFPQLEFTFAGALDSAQLQEHITQSLQNTAVANRLHFVGTVTGQAKHQLLLSSDFMVFPPIEPEGHPRVILEGMTASLPIIATNQGAIAETVLDGETGFLVPPSDAAAILAKIQFLLENPKQRQQMGQAARLRFLAHFTAETSNHRLASLFERTLAKAPSAPPNAVDWHSQISTAFDKQYQQKPAFRERYHIWTQLIDKYSQPDYYAIDMGCGSGAFTFYLAGRNRKVIGVDGSSEMIALCERKNQDKKVQFIESNLETLTGLPDEKADLIICSSVLEYVEDLKHVVALITAQLKPGGILMVSLPNKSSLYRKLEFLVFKLIKRPKYYAYVKQVMTLKEFVAQLNSLGLHLIDQQFYAETPLLSRLFRLIGLAHYADNLFVTVYQKESL